MYSKFTISPYSWELKMQTAVYTNKNTKNDNGNKGD